MTGEVGNGLVLTKELNRAEHLGTPQKMSTMSASFDKRYSEDAAQSVFYVRKQHVREDRET